MYEYQQPWKGVCVFVLVNIFCIHDTPDSWEMQFLACPIVVCDMNAEYMCCGVGLITDFIVSKNCSYTSQFADTCRVFFPYYSGNHTNLFPLNVEYSSMI